MYFRAIRKKYPPHNRIPLVAEQWSEVKLIFGGWTAGQKLNFHRCLVFTPRNHFATAPHIAYSICSLFAYELGMEGLRMPAMCLSAVRWNVPLGSQTHLPCTNNPFYRIAVSGRGWSTLRFNRVPWPFRSDTHSAGAIGCKEKTCTEILFDKCEWANKNQAEKNITSRNKCGCSRCYSSHPSVSRPVSASSEGWSWRDARKEEKIIHHQKYKHNTKIIYCLHVLFRAQRLFVFLFFLLLLSFNPRWQIKLLGARCTLEYSMSVFRIARRNQISRKTYRIMCISDKVPADTRAITGIS